MRITFLVASRNLSGGQRVTATYAHRLESRGHEVCVLSLPPRAKEIFAKLLGRSWDRSATAAWRSNPSHFDFFNMPVACYRGPVSVPSGNVVIATFWRTAPVVAALPRSKGAKAYFIQGYEADAASNLAEFEATWRLPLTKITISQWLCDIAKEQYKDNDVSLVHNSVDTDLFRAVPRNRHDPPVVGVMYSRSPFKACSVAFRAFHVLRERIPNVKLVAFGQHRPSADLPLPTGAEFHYSPAQHEIREIYGQCDVWLCASVKEGFHLPPLEAMACRCPVVSTRVGGSVDVITEAINGHIVDVGDWQALADRMHRVLTLEPAAWRAMSDAAHARAHIYTWDTATDRFEAALHHAIDVDRERSPTSRATTQ